MLCCDLTTMCLVVNLSPSFGGGLMAEGEVGFNLVGDLSHAVSVGVSGCLVNLLQFNVGDGIAVACLDD